MTRAYRSGSACLPVGAAVAVWVAAAGSGCASKYEDLQAFVQAHNHDVVASTYRIEPPDVLRISSPTSPEVNGITAAVGSDGKIQLRLLGSVKVSTLTSKEAAAKLEQLLARYYVDPKVEVSVSGYQSKKIYIFGQVGSTGPRPFTGRDTLMDVLAGSQPNQVAWGSRVRVIRPSAKPDEVHEIVVNVDRMMQEGDLRGNFLLQQGDIVYVPPTPLGWLGLRIQEALFPFTPLFYGYTWPANVARLPQAYDDLGERGYTGGFGGFGGGSMGGGGGYGNQGW